MSRHSWPLGDAPLCLRHAWMLYSAYSAPQPLSAAQLQPCTKRVVALRSARSALPGTRSLALAGASAWASRMMPTLLLTWTPSAQHALVGPAACCALRSWHSAQPAILQLHTHAGVVTGGTVLCRCRQRQRQGQGQRQGWTRWQRQLGRQRPRGLWQQRQGRQQGSRLCTRLQQGPQQERQAQPAWQG